MMVRVSEADSELESSRRHRSLVGIRLGDKGLVGLKLFLQLFRDICVFPGKRDRGLEVMKYSVLCRADWYVCGVECGWMRDRGICKYWRFLRDALKFLRCDADMIMIFPTGRYICWQEIYEYPVLWRDAGRRRARTGDPWMV